MISIYLSIYLSLSLSLSLSSQSYMSVGSVETEYSSTFLFP
jgi:hypothetical protein